MQPGQQTQQQPIMPGFSPMYQAQPPQQPIGMPTQPSTGMMASQVQSAPSPALQQQQQQQPFMNMGASPINPQGAAGYGMMQAPIYGGMHSQSPASGMMPVPIAGQVNYSMITPPINNRYKTQLCRHFQSQGQCHLQDRCSFAHGNHQLRKPYDPIPSSAQIQMNQPVQVIQKPAYSNYKTIPCRYFEQGTCKYGDNCTFAHGEDKRKQSDPLSDSQNPLMPSLPGASLANAPMSTGATLAATGIGAMGLVGGVGGGGVVGGFPPNNGVVGMQPLQNVMGKNNTSSSTGQSMENESKLQILNRGNQHVQQEIKKIKIAIQEQDHQKADNLLWQLYRNGHIVETKRYNQYQQKMRKKTNPG